MTTSGTTNFNLSNADAVLSAFSRINVRRTQLLAEHLTDAAREANLLMVEIDNRQPNLWKSELYPLSLTSGVATYMLPARAIMILACYIRTGSDQSQQDRIMYPVSTYEYASYSNKNQQGFPSTFWFNRQSTPQITFYLVPDDNGPYTAELQMVSQIQDVNLPSGETPDLPVRMLDVFVSGLAYRLARIWKPELEANRKADYAEAWAIAATQDTENVNMTLRPALSGYYR